MPIPAEVFEIAARQAAIVTRADLQGAGLDHRRVRRLTLNGSLEPIGRKTFRIPGSPAGEQQELAAAHLETGGAITLRSGARKHGLGRFPALHPPEVLTTRAVNGHHREPLARVHTTTWLPPDDLIVIDGIPCTTVARTLFGLAASVPLVSSDLVRDLVDEAVRDGKASDPWLWWRLEKVRCRGRNGVSLFEEILTRRAGGEVTESWLERQFLAVVDDAGLRRPTCQRRIEHRGAFVARVDFLYEEARVVVEVTGRAAHVTEEQRVRDAERRNQLQAAGYLVIEFTYDHVVRDPGYVVRELRAVLRIG